MCVSCARPIQTPSLSVMQQQTAHVMPVTRVETVRHVLCVRQASMRTLQHICAWPAQTTLDRPRPAPPSSPVHVLLDIAEIIPGAPRVSKASTRQRSARRSAARAPRFRQRNLSLQQAPPYVSVTWGIPVMTLAAARVQGASSRPKSAQLHAVTALPIRTRQLLAPSTQLCACAMPAFAVIQAQRPVPSVLRARINRLKIPQVVTLASQASTVQQSPRSPRQVARNVAVIPGRQK